MWPFFIKRSSRIFCSLLADRLEASTRNYKTKTGIEPTIYSSFTKDQLKNIKSVELDKIKVKGKDELITIYKPVI